MSSVPPPTTVVGHNEYLDRVLREGTLSSDNWGRWPDEGNTSSWVHRWSARDTLTLQYAWAIPNDPALDAIAALSPIVEVGAGSGYWTKLLRERGARVVPYDKDPYPLFNPWIAQSYVAISKGGAHQALRHGREDWTLFLCWPPYERKAVEPKQRHMAEECLGLHRGEYVAYVGEGWGGCTASDGFYEILEDRYDLIEEVAIPQWYGLHDQLFIYQRKPMVAWE